MNALSHTTGYAIVALGYLGCSEAPWVQAREIAAATNIPKPYLSKILHALGKAGLIRTKRGAGGGVALARPAEQITLLEVAAAVEPLINQPRCFLGMATCSDENPCPIHGFWKATRAHIEQQLTQITLAQVAAHQRTTGFRTPPLADLLSHLSRPKPTSRFLRKFSAKPAQSKL